MVAMSGRKSIVLHGLLVQISHIKWGLLIQVGNMIMQQITPCTEHHAVRTQGRYGKIKLLGKRVITYHAITHEKMLSWYFLPREDFWPCSIWFWGWVDMGHGHNTPTRQEKMQWIACNYVVGSVLEHNSIWEEKEMHQEDRLQSED